MKPDNLTPVEADRAAAFNDLVAKLKALGWVEKSTVGPAGQFEDIRLTRAGNSGLLNVNALENAIGGLTEVQAGMLFQMAHKVAHEKPHTN